MRLRFLDSLEPVDHLVRGLAEHDGAGDLGVEAARPVVLDQQREMLAGFERAALLMAVDEIGALAERRRAAEEQPLLAAEHPPLVLGERGHLGVAHARANLLEHAGEYLVLHQGGAADQRDLLLALDRLEAVDELGRVDELGAPAEVVLDALNEAVRHRALADKPDGAAAAVLERIDRDLRLVFVGVSDRGERGRGEQLADAAVDLVAAFEIAPAAVRTHLDDAHRVVSVEDHRARIAVDRREVGEPLDVAAEPVVAVLHHQRVDAAFLHLLAHGRPAAFQFRGRDRREQAFVHDGVPDTFGRSFRLYRAVGIYASGAEP